MKPVPPHIDPASVATFLAAAETSFSHAATAMNLSRSAVTQTIERLEKSWGVTLFDRSSRPMHLTPQGQTAVAIARRYLAEAQVFTESLSALKTQKVQSLRFVISEVARAFAGAEIEAALIPQVTSFTAETGLIPAVQKRFAEGKTDLAIAPDLPEKERLFAKKLCSEHYCLVTPKSVASQDEMPLSAILPNLTLPFVSYQRDSLDWQKSQRIIRLLKLPVGRSLALENTQAVAQTVASGLGWSILPPMNLWCVRNRLKGLTIHGLGATTAEKTLWVAAKEARFAPYLTLASQIFLQCLKTKWTREMVLVKPAVSHFLSFESEA